MCEYVVQRPASGLPQAATETIFTISGGNVLLKALVATVTSDIESYSGDITETSVTLGAPGGFGSFEGLQAGTVVSGIVPQVWSQDITWQYVQSLTGQVRWTLVYEPLDYGAFVEAT